MVVVRYKQPEMLPVSPILRHWLAPFAAFFTKPTWERVLVLVTGAVLAPGRRTVTAVLSVLGRRRDGFRPLPWRAQPRPLVRAVAGPRPAALAGRGVCSGWPGGGWDRRDDRAALGAEDLGARHRQRPGALLAWSLCQGQRAALGQRHAAGPDPVG